MVDNESNTLQWLKDRADIIDTILRFFYAVDIQNWRLLRSCLAETLDIDYTDLRGEPRQLVFADDFVASRAKDWEGLRMQHISSNHLVTISQGGEGAECTSCFLIHRINPNLVGEAKIFDSAGHYVHALTQTSSGWLINAIKQTVVWSRGNPQVHGAFRHT